MVSEDARPRPTGAYRGKDLTQEYLFFDHGGDRLHVLNATAREIYLLCDGTRTLSAIAAAIVERYEVDEATAKRDVAAAVDELLEKRLVAV